MSRYPTTEADTHAFITALRAVAPNRQLTYGESLAVARRQAEKLRCFTKSDGAAINLAWLLNQEAVPVTLIASHQLGEESGLTTDAVTGRLQIFLNRAEPHTRQRFSLMHEFKHVLDFPDAERLHGGLGCGDPQIQASQIELIANEFAGQVLMPRRLVTSAWFATGDLSIMAKRFDVSREAMRTRLEKLGLIGEDKPRRRDYFRLHGGAPAFGEVLGARPDNGEDQAA